MNAPAAFASIPACSTTAFYQPLTNSYYSSVYCDGASVLHYYLNGLEVTPPTAASTWTVVNGSSGTAAKADSAGAVTLSTTSGVLGLEALLKAVPSAPYTRTLVIKPLINQGNGTTGTVLCGALWSNGDTTTSDPQAATVAAFNSLISPAFYVWSWTDFAWGSQAVQNFYNGFVGIDGQLWIKLVDDNTNRSVTISNDGVNFITVYPATGRTSPITPTHYGVGCGLVTAGNTYPWSITLLADY
jgi:hypothetical protein